MPKTTRAVKDDRLKDIDVHIPSNIAWCVDEEISLDVKFLGGVIYELSRNKYWCCWASNENLGNRLGKSERGIRRYIELLETKGFVKRIYAEIRDSDGKIRCRRTIVPTEFLKKFETMQNKMQDLKGSQKNTQRADKVDLSRADKVDRLYIKDKYPYEKNITKEIIKEGYISTPTPSKGFEAARLVETEQFDTFGKFENVHLTQSQKAALVEEFGADMVPVLIEQLSSYIQSGVKRQRKNADHYAQLRDWALRRTEPKLLPPPQGDSKYEREE